MTSEKFCLRWNDFETNISVAFRELRDDKDFFDVTLACDDEQIQAHKMILSACSPFFRNILRRNPHQHPLLYLKGVKFTDLQSVLNFMYHGEVNIKQEELNSFLAVAEDLRVKGLTQNQQTEKEKPNEPQTTNILNNVPAPRSAIRQKNHDGQLTKQPPFDSLPSLKHSRPTPPTPATPTSSNYPSTSHRVDDDIQEVISVKTEPRDSHQAPAPAARPPAQDIYQDTESHSLAPVEEDGYGYQDDQYDQYEQHQDHQEYPADTSVGEQTHYEPSQPAAEPSTRMFQDYIAKSDTNSGWQCTICGKESAQKGNLGKHVENVHFPDSFSYDCKYCRQSFNTKNKLYVHIARTHKS